MKKMTRMAAVMMVVAALAFAPSMAMAAPAAPQARIGGGFSFLNSILGLFGFGSVDGAIWGGGNAPGPAQPDGAIWGGGNSPGPTQPDGAIWGGGNSPEPIQTDGAIWG